MSFVCCLITPTTIQNQQGEGKMESIKESSIQIWQDRWQRSEKDPVTSLLSLGPKSAGRDLDGIKSFSFSWATGISTTIFSLQTAECACGASKEAALYVLEHCDIYSVGRMRMLRKIGKFSITPCELMQNEGHYKAFQNVVEE